ncbi:MAG TPA: heparan N-sulfatase, partial [Verrucomicrobiales bacterium]|nr:heparan N-sulfatase [Verrucomicrobiales bacterium]
MVQYADVLPTIMELAGGVSEEKGFDGTSFHKVLSGLEKSHRSFVFGMHNNVPEGPPYPIRSVFDG